MRAIVATAAGGPEVLTISEVETPRPAHDEILVHVSAAGVNRADLLQRRGHYPPPPGTSDIIGLEVSGHVAEVGADVDGWTPGAPCVALLAGGGYAEYVAVPSGQVVPPPDDVDLATAGGLMEVAATVVSNLDEAGLRPGETLLVHGGAGGIGTFAIQYARALGARVIATAGSPAKVEHCLEYGADLALNYHDEWTQALAEAEVRADVILDVVGAKYLESNVSALARGGRLVVIGLQGGRKGTLDLNALLSRNASVRATSLRFRPVDEKSLICARVAESVWPLVSVGMIKPAPETRFRLEDAAQAHAQLESGDNVGKIILDV